MSPDVINLLSNLPTHGLLIVALWVLWRRLEKLTDHLLEIKTHVQAIQAQQQKNGELPF